jgi:hypothetical protein
MTDVAMYGVTWISDDLRGASSDSDDGDEVGGGGGEGGGARQRLAARSGAGLEAAAVTQGCPRMACESVARERRVANRRYQTHVATRFALLPTATATARRYPRRPPRPSTLAPW